MSDGIEYTQVVAAFLTQKLKNDPTMTALINGRVYDTDIPQAGTTAEREAVYPCVLFDLQAADRVLAGPGDSIVWAPADYRVFAVGWTKSFAALAPISARIFQLLHGAQENVSAGGYINWCRYLRAVKAAPIVAGISYRHLGGLFKIAARLSAQ